MLQTSFYFLLGENIKVESCMVFQCILGKVSDKTRNLDLSSSFGVWPYSAEGFAENPKKQAELARFFIEKWGLKNGDNPDYQKSRIRGVKEATKDVPELNAIARIDAIFVEF